MERQLALRYIQLIKQQAYPYYIDEEIQPHFWDAILLLCQDKTIDVSSLLLGNPDIDQFIVVLERKIREGVVYKTKYSKYGVNRFLDYNASTVKDLVYKIAEEISDWDSMSLDEIKLMMISTNYGAMKKLRNKIKE